jgi:hypothetical protein
MPRAKKPPKVYVRSRADGFRVRRLELFIAALKKTDAALVSCRREQAVCVVRMRASLRVANNEQKRYNKIHDENLIDLTELSSRDLTALSLSRGMTEAMAGARSELKEAMDEAAGLLRAVNRRKGKRIRRYE